MKLSLVTINFNGTRETEKLVASLDQQTDKDFELIVIDNDSSEEQKTELRKLAQPWIRIIENETNSGFSGGNNIGIKAALEKESQWVICINNDTWVKPQFIASVKAFISCRAGMIVALPLREGEETVYAGSVRWLEHTLPHVKHLITSSFFKKEQGYVIGAGIAIHRSLFEKIGFWDERYFLYFEDADFSVRALKAGINFDIAPVVVYHRVQASTQLLGAPLLLRYHYRNMFLFNQLHAPWHIKIILPIWAFLGIIKQMLKLVAKPDERPQSRAIFAGILDYLTGRFGRIQS